MNRLSRSVFALCTLFAAGGLAIGCAAAPDEALGEDAEALTRACSADSCAALARPKPLQRGGLAVVGARLYWLELGADIEPDGAPVEVLSSCELPACSTVEALPLRVDGKTIRAHDLRAAAGHVLFAAKKPDAIWGQLRWREDLFLSDGATLTQIDEGYDPDHDVFAVDQDGLTTYTKDRSQGGWARSTLRHCPFASGGASLSRSCATLSEKSLNWLSGITMTPTRVLAVGTTGVYAYDRSTMAKLASEPVPVETGNQITALGERGIGYSKIVTTSGGKVRHSSILQRGGSAPFAATIDGAITDVWATAKNLYVSSVGEGDIFDPDREGCVARLSSTGRRTVIATQQNAHAVAVHGANVYWLDRARDPSDEQSIGVVRFAKK